MEYYEGRGNGKCVFHYKKFLNLNIHLFGLILFIIEFWSYKRSPCSMLSISDLEDFVVSEGRRNGQIT